MSPALARFVSVVTALAATSLSLGICSADESVRLSAVIVHLISKTAPIRLEIEQRALSNNTIERSGAGIYLPLNSESYGPSLSLVTVRGTISISNSKFRLLIVLEPVLRNGNMEWICTTTNIDASKSENCRVTNRRVE